MSFTENTVEHSPDLDKLSQHLNALSQHIYSNNKAKGFWDEERNIGELLMLVVSELGEAIEAHRKAQFTQLSSDDKLSMNTKMDKISFEKEVKNTFEDEIADTMIRLLDLSAGLSIDIGWHLKQKVTYNTFRSIKHGKKY